MVTIMSPGHLVWQYHYDNLLPTGMLINLAAGRSSSGSGECCPPVVNPYVLLALIGGNLTLRCRQLIPKHRQSSLLGLAFISHSQACSLTPYLPTSGIALATYFLRQAMLINITKRKRKRSIEEEDSPGQIQMGESNY